MSGGPFNILGGVDYMDAMANPQLAKQYAAQPRGILDTVGQAFADNSGLLMGYGAGGFDGAMQGMQQDERTKLIRMKQAQEEQRKVEAQKLAQSMKLPPGLASDPDTVFALAQDRYKYRAPEKLSLEQQIWGSLDEGQKKQYIQNEYLTPKNARAAPSGYEFNPDGTLRAIQGGPQDPEREMTDPLPGELAAKFGLARQYDERFGGIEGDLLSKDPKAAGAIDGLGFGASGSVQRDMKLGSEAMVRMLTGAGMSESEAANEVKQYLPSMGDSPETILDKQYRLRAALRDMQREALKGRRSNRQIEKEYPRYEAPTYDDIVKRRQGALSGNASGPVSSGASDAVKARAGALKQKYGLE